jgi:homogentisate 1,2-dioxygenase
MSATGSPENGKMELQYQVGFGNHFATEALKGSLPVGQNSPQVCAHGRCLQAPSTR